MADSDAVRSARRRRHAAGDHSMCKPGRCAGAGRAARASAGIPAVAAGSAGDLDPQAAMAELAEQMRAAYEADPGNSNLAREYRLTLMALAPRRDDSEQREWNAFIAELSKPVVTTDDDG